MAQIAKHVFVSAKADGADTARVRPLANWNDGHVFSGGANGNLLMRDTGDATYGGDWTAGLVWDNTNKLLQVTENLAGTAAVDLLYVTKNTTGTPANNMGPGILFRGESSTTVDSNMASIRALWSDVTHATRSAYLSFLTVNSAAALAEKMRLTAAGLLGVGITPTVAIQAVGQIGAADSGTTFDSGYAGRFLSTRPAATSGQHLTMVRAATATWSIGFRYNTSDFLIAAGQATDSNFLSTLTPSLAINATNHGLYLYGSGQATATAISTSANLGGAAMLQDSNTAGNSGGMVVFGSNQGFWAAIKGNLSDGTNNTLGHLIFATRNASTDATLATRMTLFADGGVNIGAPTGGDKGAGTLNATAVYDDNVLLTDFLWDLYYDSALRPEDQARWETARLWSIADTREFTRQHRHLPTLPGRAAWETSGARSLGQMVTALWQTVEQLQMHIFALDAKMVT